LSHEADAVEYKSDSLIEGHGVEDKKKSNVLIIASKIAYFPFALIACFQLAMWAAVGTDTYLLGDPVKLSGGHFVLSEGLLFLLIPVWFLIFLIACVVAFFWFRRKNEILILIFMIMVALSVQFFASLS
jgi:hypothetical protein